MSKDNKLSGLFYGLQAEMLAKLEANQKNEEHPVTKGDVTELCWLEMLQSYLPKRYQAEKACVLDSRGKKSEQIDIVIFDQQYSPFLFKDGASIYVPAESVYAVIEVKQNLCKANIEYAAKKTQSVRKLFRTNAPIYHAGGIIHQPKDPFSILSGILTYKSDYRKMNSKSFQGVLSKLSDNKQINFGCALNKGSFITTKDDSLEFNIKISNSKNALIMFFLNLVNSLQKLGTVPAIEIEQYAKSLKD